MATECKCPPGTPDGDCPLNKPFEVDITANLGQCVGHDRLKERCGNQATHLGWEGMPLCDVCNEEVERWLQQRTDTYRKELAEARAKHPGACTACLGTGLGEEDVCHKCIDRMNCPRCGCGLIPVDNETGEPAELGEAVQWFSLEELQCSQCGTFMMENMAALLPEDPFG